jgi:formate dehydrogenase subunit delta
LKSSLIPEGSRSTSVQRRVHMSPDRLIYMANQIGKFFQILGHDKAVLGIAEHIKRFWDPRMRRAIFAHLDSDGTGLDPNVHEAIQTLRQVHLTAAQPPP